MIRFDPRQPRGIVWIASYPRSGNTWVRVFLNCLYRTMFDAAPENLDLNRLGNLEASDLSAAHYEKIAGLPFKSITAPMISALRPQVQRAIASTAKGLVLVKTHSARMPDRGTPTIAAEATAGSMYLVRNPLDVAISWAHLRGISVDQAIADMETPGYTTGGTPKTAHWIAGSWSENVASWSGPRDDATLVMRYEDLLVSPSESFAQLAQHLRLAPRPDHLARAIEMSSFDRLRDLEERQGFSERPASTEQFFRVGRSGQWREHLTESQIERVVGKHGKRMERFGYWPPAAEQAA